MGDMKSELAKLGDIGKSAGPSTSCDARPSATIKPQRKSPQYKTRRPVAVRALMDQYGSAKAAEMLYMSTSGLSTATSRDSIGAAVEALAEMIIHNEGKTVVRPPRQRLYVVRVPHADADVFTRVVNGLGYKVRDLGDE